MCVGGPCVKTLALDLEQPILNLSCDACSPADINPSIAEALWRDRASSNPTQVPEVWSGASLKTREVGGDALLTLVWRRVAVQRIAPVTSRQNLIPCPDAYEAGAIGLTGG